MMKEAAPRLYQLSSINADGSRKHLQPADVHGRFVTWRRVVYALLISIYVMLPFLKIGGRPAVQLDVVTRRFYLFGSVFNAQDFWRVVFLLLVMGFGLLFVTAWYGRVWCGWACPQTVFLEGVYRRIERLIEGPRERRIRLAAAPWSFDKAARKVTKHAAYVAVSMILAHIALAFFVSLPSAFEMVRHNPGQNWVAFLWVVAFTSILYFNFAWFREQLCVIVCPYGRLQSAMLDRDSVIIGYDAKRGEPRGKLSKTKIAEEPRGDCVDCARCVNVCPTGIDIRNGTQLECIGCAQCIDACDEVMSKLGRPEGLIRYDSLAGLEGAPKRVLRPRLVVYGALLLAAVAALVLASVLRKPFEANVVRVRGAPYVLDAGVVRNQFELHLVNKNPTATVFHVQVKSPEPLDLTLPTRDIRVASLEHFRLPIFASIAQKDFKHPFNMQIEVQDEASSEHTQVTVEFLGPAHAF